MGEPGDVAAVLRAAGTRWTTLRGVMRHRRRHDLVTVGFERHFAASAASGTGWRVDRTSETAVDAALDDRSVIEAVLAVAADRDGRRRVEALSRQGDEWLADLVVVDGPTWWARTGDGVLTNDGDATFRHGGTEELDLLTPDRVPLGYDLVPASDVDVVAGRSCTIVIATPRATPVGAGLPGSEVFGMIAGGDQFRLSVDRDTGVLLRVVKLVDDSEAETVEFLEIAVDGPLPQELFAGLT